MNFYYSSDYFLLLRVHPSSPKAWSEDTPARLASQKLARQRGGCSVYKVNSYQEEVQVTAGHYPKLDKTSVEKIWGLRIPVELITVRGMTFENTPGEVGFRFVDERHFDIKGSNEQFEALAEDISKHFASGEDLIRSFEPGPLRSAMSEFYIQKIEEMTPAYIKLLKQCLSIV